jgi:hypothetical protein
MEAEVDLVWRKRLVAGEAPEIFEGVPALLPGDEAFTAAWRARTNAIAADTRSRDGGFFFCDGGVWPLDFDCTVGFEEADGRCDEDAGCCAASLSLFVASVGSLADTAGMLLTAFDDCFNPARMS